MSALHRKLLREFWRMRSQALAIAIVVAGGIATLIMALTSLDSLRDTRDSFYRDYRFADVFATLTRAPESLRAQIAAIDGVQFIDTRVVGAATLEVHGPGEGIYAQMVSLPDGRNSELNALYLRQGRLPEAGRANEAVVSDAFAEVHQLVPGDRLTAIIHGRRQALDIVGVALSPEFIHQQRPGELLPDHARFAILWMNREALAAAYDMIGSFNNVTLSLQRNSRSGDVVDALDQVLARYGSRGAITREDQSSHRPLSEELKQIGTMARTIPTIFLGVAAFLLNVVVSRLIGTQREQIGALKAFGYSRFDIALHYLQLVYLITLLGFVIGVAGGLWLGSNMSLMYAEFFRFPYLDYGLTYRSIVIGGLVSLAAATLGTWSAVSRAARLPPAEAMRPESPQIFRRTIIERLGIGHLLNQPTRMMLRSIERRPMRATLSVLAMAFAAAILMTGQYQRNAIDHMVGMQFNLVQRDDISVTFIDPESARAIHELASIQGVEVVEPVRAVAAELFHEHRSFRLALQGIEPTATMRRLLDTRLEEVSLPAGGLLLTDYLAELLQVSVGDTLNVQLLEGRRERISLSVVGTISEYLGVSAYIHRADLNAIMREGDVLNMALLGIDNQHRTEVLRELERRPGVLSVMERQAAIDSFYENLAGNVLIFSLITTVLAGSIAFGVIYNNARIALAERGRELASLRVFGFRRSEIAWILQGEQALLTLAALPIGFVLGYLLYGALARASDSDLYRIPVIPSLAALGFATLIIGLASVLSAWAIRRRLNQLDMVAVLKTRE